jgi:outer membrane protein TolC
MMIRLRSTFIAFALLIISWDNSYAQKIKLRISLEEAIEIAKDQSPSALVAKHNFLASYWQFRAFRAQLLPSLNLSATLGNYNRSLVPLQNSETGEINYVANNNLKNSLSLSIDQNIALTGGRISLFTSLYRLDQFNSETPAMYNSQPLNITYIQPLRTYNNLKWDKVTEPKRYERAKRRYLEQMENITGNVIPLYFDVLQAQQRLAMSSKNYDNTVSLYKLTKERFERGMVSKNDVLQLELRMINENLSINDHKLTLDMRMLRLKTFMGYNEHVELELEVPDSGPEITLNFDEVLDKAYKNSSFLLDNELNLLSAEQEVERNRANTGIQANLNAQFGLTQQGDELGTAYSNPMDQQIISLGLRLPIIDWGLGKGRVKMARSRQELIKAQVDQELNEFKQNVFIKVIQFNNQVEQCNLSSRADSIARERYENARQRFLDGTIGVTELNNAQNEKDQASNRYINDLGNFWQYYFNIRRMSLYDYLKREDLSAEFDKMVDN